MGCTPAAFMHDNLRSWRIARASFVVAMHEVIACGIAIFRRCANVLGSSQIWSTSLTYQRLSVTYDCHSGTVNDAALPHDAADSDHVS